MAVHLQLGALIKDSETYVYPFIASKAEKYICPVCKKDVIFKAGKIKCPHFAHKKSDNPCFFYDKPKESEIHKDAKMLLCKVINDKRSIALQRKCINCISNFFLTFSLDLNDTKAVMEHSFHFLDSRRQADVAALQLKDSSIKYIFEICNTSKTKEENRPEPWFEFDCRSVIQMCNQEGEIQLECIRNYKCDKCKQRDIEEKELYIKLMQKEEEERIQRRKMEEEERLKQIFIYNEEMKRRKLYEEQEATLKLEREYAQAKYIMMQNTCKCGVMFSNICKCLDPKFEMHKLSKNMICLKCKKWKDRCI